VREREAERRQAKTNRVVRFGVPKKKLSGNSLNRLEPTALRTGIIEKMVIGEGERKKY
jgi:hypothetical protein